MSEPQQLQYESSATTGERRRVPAWVWSIVGVYGLLLVAFLSMPTWLSWMIDTRDWTFAVVVCSVVVAMTCCGLALLFTPVRLVRRRSISRKSYLFPLIASGLLMGGLVYAAGLALWELSDLKSSDWIGWAIIAAAVIVWSGWSIVLWLATRNRDPASLAMRFHRWLLGGSVVELLVAVSSHVVVRRRNECCAGFMTGTAICLGAMIMIVSFGPSVFMLYWRRSRQIRV